MLKSMIAAALAMLLAGAAAAQAPSEVVFRNVRVFDGRSDHLTAPTSVLVRGNLIAAIGPAAVASAPFHRIAGAETDQRNTDRRQNRNAPRGNVLVLREDKRNSARVSGLGFIFERRAHANDIAFVYRFIDELGTCEFGRQWISEIAIPAS